ncbi:MAG: glycine betaine/L-proline ABC transporter ATP-binding protein, partial [Cyanobacteria bacterium J06629_2]
TIIFISHDVHEAFKIGDRLGVMKEGKIVQVGTPEAIFNQPANDYIRAFIQDIYDLKKLIL